MARDLLPYQRVAVRPYAAIDSTQMRRRSDQLGALSARFTLTTAQAEEFMMSIRANSLQTVVLDSVYFAALMGLGAAIMVTMARGAEPRPLTAAEAAADRRLTDDHIDSQQNMVDKMPSGDPTESSAAKRQAIMLGMTLHEESEGHIQVKDVAATSPAWDAGIRPGDRVLSIDGVKPKTLSAWIDDVGRVLKDTPDGHAVSTEVERKGDTLALRIKVPVSKAAEVRDARQEERALAEMAANNQQQQIPLGQQGGQIIVSSGETGGAGYGPGNGGYALGGWGLGGFFNDEEPNRTGNNTNDDRLANRAIAQLMAVNTLSGGTNDQSGHGQNAQSTGGQVGIAAFQNMAEGVHAVVVVRGLPQGVYRVGIGQGDAFAGGFGTNAMGTDAVGTDAVGTDPNLNARNMNQRDLSRGNDGRDNRVVPEPQMNNQPRTAIPSTPATPVQPAPAGDGAPVGGAGAADGASLADPRSAAILAQQMDPQQMPDAQNGNPGLAPGTFPNNQSGNGNQAQTGNDTASNINPANANNNVRPTPLGTLRVGPDGSGRFENQLDGVQVRSLAGMSVTIYSDMAQGGGLSGNNPQGFGGPNQSGAQNRQQNQVPGALNGGGTQGIVATGVIQIMEGNANDLGQQQGRSLFPGDERADNQRNGDQRNGNQATQDQRDGGQISDPREDFNPATPQ